MADSNDSGSSKFPTSSAENSLPPPPPASSSSADSVVSKEGVGIPEMGEEGAAEEGQQLLDGSSDDDAAVFMNDDDVEEEYEVEGVGLEADGDDAMMEGDDGAGMGEDEDMKEDCSIAAFTKHTDSVYCIAVNPMCSRQFITGGGDDRAFLWTFRYPSPSTTAATAGAAATEGQDEDNPSENDMITDVSELKGHTDSVSCVGFCSDGTLAASGAYDGKVLTWDSQTGKQVAVLEGPEDVEWLAWHGKGKVVIAGSADATVWMWMASTGTCMQVFAGHQSKVTCGLFAPNGKQVVTGSEDGSLKLWAPKTGECKKTFSGHGFHEAALTCVAVHPGGESQPLVLSGSLDGTACMVHLQSGKVVLRVKHSEAGGDKKKTIIGGSAKDMMQEEEAVFSVECVGFAHTHTWFSTGGLDGNLKMWDITTGTRRHTCKHPGGVTALLWHTVHPSVFTSCADGTIRCWDSTSGSALREWTGHGDMILGMLLVAIGPDTGTGAGTAVGDMAAGGGKGEGGAPEAAQGAGAAAAAVGDTEAAQVEEFLASCSDDGTARIFPLTNGLVVT